MPIWVIPQSIYMRTGLGTKSDFLVEIQRKIVTSTEANTPVPRVVTPVDPHKRFKDDWAKANAHQMLKEMIERTLLKTLKPEDIRVLCFAGIDVQEVRAIYYQLGIPPSNITSLERDAKIAEEIRRQEPQMKVIAQSLEDYISEHVTQNSKLGYNVVSLDFSGPISSTLVSTMQAIFRMSSSKNMIFHSANLLLRDNDSYAEYYAGAAIRGHMHQDWSRTSEGYSSGIINPSSIVSALVDFEERFSAEKIKSEIKAEFYPYVIFGAMSSISTKKYHDLIKFLCGENFQIIEKEIVDSFRNLAGDHANSVRNLKQVLDNPLSTSPVFDAYLIKQVSSKLSESLREYGLDSPALHATVLSCLIDSSMESSVRIPTEAEHYSYISQSRVPMIGSIYHITKSEKRTKAEKDLATACGFPKDFRIDDVNKFCIALSNLISQVIEEMNYRELTEQSFAVKYLGDASIPYLSRQLFFDELDSGLTVDQVKLKYNIRGKSNIPKWMAAYKRGDKEAEEAQEETETKSITKEEAIDMISSGIPVETVFEQYPTSFSLRQLRAYKAHVSMKTYKRD